MTKQAITPSTDSVSLKLLDLLSQEVLTPLTSILGMASVLSQEIYGPLTPKQKEYINILNERSRYLRSLVEEIAALAKLTQGCPTLERTTADVEHLCLRAIATLESEASRRQVKMNLSSGLEDIANPKLPNSRLLLLDRTVFLQMLHNLLLSVIDTADEGTTIKCHLSRKPEQLDLALWMFHPMLGESLPHLQLYTSKLTDSFNRVKLTASDLALLILGANKSPDLLRLLLACQLLELQGGTFWIQGSPGLGYRYFLSFPVNN